MLYRYETSFTTKCFFLHRSNDNLTKENGAEDKIKQFMVDHIVDQELLRSFLEVNFLISSS